MTDQAPKNATLTIDGVSDPIVLPIYSGSVGPDVIDVGKLTSQGYFTYDPGFVSTASCDSDPVMQELCWLSRNGSSCC